jgi:ParB family transcriptional regulator, chromosome partitioning protein
MSKNETQPRRALGRGVGALLPTRTAPPPPPVTPEALPNERPFTVAIDAIDPNPLQPRRTFQPDKLQELAQSITHNGIVQPLVVRRADSRYQLIAGERRLRAARLANLTEVPVVVREVDDRQLLQITLIENIQREDLNAIETAEAFQRLGTDLSLSVEDIATQTGKDRTTIVNFIRLLQLPEDLQELVANHKLSAGHARCLLRLPPELARETANKAIANGWSVRHMERVAQNLRLPAELKDALEDRPVDPNVRAAIDEMERVLGTKVKIIEKRKGGRIEVEYYSTDDLHRIYAAIVREQ